MRWTVRSERHQLVRLLARVAEHQTLVAGPVTVDAHGDVARLAVQAQKDAARVGIKTDVVARVADVADDRPGDADMVDLCPARDLAGQHDQVRRAERLAGDTGLRVLLQERVEDAVGDLVGNLVRVAHAHGFARKQHLRTLRHARLPENMNFTNSSVDSKAEQPRLSQAACEPACREKHERLASSSTVRAVAPCWAKTSF